MSGKTLQMILERIAPGGDPDCFQLWACRGEGRGCKRNGHREKKKHCEDCVLAGDPNETLEHLQARLDRGDA